MKTSVRTHMKAPTSRALPWASLMADVRDDARGDTGGDGVRERHQDHGEEDRDGDRPVAPVHVPGVLHHHRADDDQGGGGHLGRHDRRERGEEEAGGEEEPGDDGGEPGAGALADAGGGLDEDGLAGAAGDTADGTAGAVDEQRLRQARHAALVVGELRLGADTDDGGHGVEEAGQHQGEDDHADRHARRRRPSRRTRRPRRARSPAWRPRCRSAPAGRCSRPWGRCRRRR